MVFAFFSCTENSDINQVEKRKILLNFDQNKSNLRHEGFLYKENGILRLESDDMELVKAKNIETGEESLMIILKENKNNSRGSISRGYFYNGGDCFIYGTWYHGDNGVSLFVPADAATQYLLNSCGWSNVA